MISDAQFVGHSPHAIGIRWNYRKRRIWRNTRLPLLRLRFIRHTRSGTLATLSISLGRLGDFRNAIRRIHRASVGLLGVWSRGNKVSIEHRFREHRVVRITRCTAVLHKSRLTLHNRRKQQSRIQSVHSLISDSISR